MTSRESMGALGGLPAVGNHKRLRPRPAPPLIATLPDPSCSDRLTNGDLSRGRPSGPGSESLAGQEDERRELAIMADRERIASDLHDLVIQRLFAAGLALQSTAKITVDPQIARRLDHVIDELDAAIVDIRSSIFALGHRCKSTSGDLRGQILDLVADAARTLGHDPSMRFYGPVATAVPDVVADHLIAVLREALSNVARHAHATKTTINLHVSGYLLLQVTDNGVGTAGSSPSNGLRNMASRAESLGGGSELTSPGGAGSCVKWWVPVRRSEEALGPSVRLGG